MNTIYTIIKKLDCFMLITEERRDLQIYTVLKNLEDVIIELMENLDKLPDCKTDNPDIEAITYHSRSIDLIVSKLDEKGSGRDYLTWKAVYNDLIDIFNENVVVEEDSRDEEKVLNICDIIATLYVKFSFLKEEFHRSDVNECWKINYAFETDWGEDLEYLLEILPGIRSLITAQNH